MEITTILSNGMVYVECCRLVLHGIFSYNGDNQQKINVNDHLSYATDYVSVRTHPKSRKN